MIENTLIYWACVMLLPMLLAGLLGALIAWFLRPKHDGDMDVEGETKLRAEADGLRARIRELEGRVGERDTAVSDLKGKLAAASAAAATAAVATKAVSDKSEATPTADDDETYALEWRNRYLAARVKYLEGRVAEQADAKAKPKAKSKAKPAVKKTASSKNVKAKAAPKPKVLYTDGPTDGPKDDLKLIKGIGPKFEKDLNSKGIYYFRQIGSWKAADVKMVEGVIDSIPGRIKRDEWVKQARGLEKSSAKAMAAGAAGAATLTAAGKPRKKPGPKPGTKRSNLTAAGKPRKKPGPKPGSKRSTKPKMSEKEAKFEKYYTNVKKYDSRAKRETVQKIVNYCGVSLRSRDTSLVSCSDKTERETVAKGFATKKLGLKDGQMDLVDEVCTQMKPDRFKSRVTFYYLMAKKAGKLDMFGG